MPLTTKIRVSLVAAQTGANDFGGPSFEPEMIAALNLASGTVANAADVLWMDQRTLASGASDQLDLAGVLTDAFGATVAMAELVGIFIINGPRAGAVNTTALTIGGGTTPIVGFLGGTTPTIGPLQPGAFIFMASPHASGLGAVAAGTADNLRITNAAGAAATYQIAILGRTA